MMTSQQFLDKANELTERLEMSKVNDKGRDTIMAAISLIRKISEETKPQRN